MPDKRLTETLAREQRQHLKMHYNYLNIFFNSFLPPDMEVEADKHQHEAAS